MSTDSDAVIEKYEEKFIRKLGEVAILLHLAKSPEGSHAYEMRQKASEIFFEKKNQEAVLIQKHLKVLNELNELLSQYNTDSSDFKEKRKEIKEEIDNFLILKHNVRFQQILSENYTLSKEDIEYTRDLIADIAISTIDIIETSVIWSNVSGIYPAIDSLEKNGLIEMMKEDPEGGRLKKIYIITDIGRKSLSRVMSSLLDISSFIFETETNKTIHQSEGILPSRLLPLRKILVTLTDDLTPEFKKKLDSFRNKPQEMPYIFTVMEQGITYPKLNFLVNHPDLLEDHLDATDSEEDRNFLKSFIRKRLLDRRKMIDKLLKKL